MVYYRKIKAEMPILFLRYNYKHPIMCDSLRELLCDKSEVSFGVKLKLISIKDLRFTIFLRNYNPELVRR